MGRVIVDAHVHVMPDSVRADVDAVMAADQWFELCHRGSKRLASPGTLLESMDTHGIDRAVCFTWPFASAERCREANDWLAATVRRHPDRLVGFGVIQPAHPGASAEVERCARIGLRGIGELNADAQGWGLHGESVAHAVAASVAAGLPWTLHCSEPVGHDYPGKGRATPDAIAAFAEQHEELELICAHLGGGLPLYSHMREVAALCRRLYFDTAAQPFVYEASVYRTLVDGIGADRILLGTDYPLLEVPRYLAALDGARVSGADRDAICGANAVRLLHL